MSYDIPSFLFFLARFKNFSGLFAVCEINSALWTFFIFHEKYDRS